MPNLIVHLHEYVYVPIKYKERTFVTGNACIPEEGRNCYLSYTTKPCVMTLRAPSGFQLPRHLSETQNTVKAIKYCAYLRYMWKDAKILWDERI